MTVKKMMKRVEKRFDTKFIKCGSKPKYLKPKCSILSQVFKVFDFVFFLLLVRKKITILNYWAGIIPDNFQFSQDSIRC